MDTSAKRKGFTPGSLASWAPLSTPSYAPVSGNEIRHLHGFCIAREPDSASHDLLDHRAFGVRDTQQDRSLHRKDAIGRSVALDHLRVFSPKGNHPCALAISLDDVLQRQSASC